MKTRLLRSTELKSLVDNISGNLDLYRNGTFDDLILDSSKYIEIDHEIDESKLSLIQCEDDNYFEVENCIRIFEAMGGISHYLARDERLWVYLTHTELLAYARKRWPIPDDDEKAVGFIKNHFFVVGARGFERDNAISKLWWMASLCNRTEGLSLERSLICLLEQFDVRDNIVGRPTTSQSVHVFSAILRRLSESYDGDKSLFVRERFREVMKKLNLVGGIKLLAALDEKDIEEVLKSCL